MWARLLLCFLVAALGANAEHGWKVGKQYDYTVRGRTLAALHDVANQYSGVLLKAKLHIQPESEDTLNARVVQAEQAEVQQQLPGGWNSPIDESTISYKPLALTDEPFQLKLKNGVIRQLVVSGKLPQDEVNFVKSLASQLQVDTLGENKESGSDGDLPSEDSPNGVYEVMEDSVTGKCRVQYDVSELPRFILQSRPEMVAVPELAGGARFIEIVKTSNYSHCQNRPEFHFGLNGLHQWKPASAKMGQFFSRSSVSRVIISGNINQYTVQSSFTTNKVVLSPALYNAQKGVVVSWMNVSLIALGPSHGSPQQPRDAVEYQDLVYRFADHLTSQRRPSMMRDDDSSEEINPNALGAAQSMRRRPHQSRDSSVENTAALPKLDQDLSMLLYPDFVGGRFMDKSKLYSLVISYTKQISEELEKPSEIPSKATLAKFTLLATLMRCLNMAELLDLAKKINVAESDKNVAWKVYRDAVAEAGTGPAFLVITRWIVENTITEQEAAELLATLPQSARFPTKDYLKAFFILVTSQKVRQQQYLNTTAVLSFAELVRLAQVDSETVHNRYPSHIFGHQNPQDYQDVTTEYIPFFKNALKKAVQNKDSVRIQTYTRVLGNFGHPQIVEVFEPYLSGKVHVTSFQRLNMVVAMNQLAKSYPDVARAALLKIYQNVADVYQVRAAAVAMLMKTNPPPSVLQRMAESTKDEYNPHIRAIVVSAIQSAAQLQSWDSWELTTHGKAAQSMLNTSDINAHLSQLFMKSYDVKDSPLAYHAGFTNIGSQDSFAPQAAHFSVRQNLGDFKLNPEGFGTMTSSISELFRTVADQFGESKSWTASKSTPFRSSFGWSIQDILSEMNIIRDEAEPIEANMLFETLAGKRFFSLDNQTIQQLPYEFQKVAQELREGKRFNYTKLYNQYTVSMSFPTVTGFLFYYSLSTPTLLSLGGKTRVIMNPQPTAGKLFVPKTLNATFDIHAVVSSKIEAEIGFVDCLNFQRYTAGLDKDMQLNLPVQAHFDVEIHKNDEKKQFVEIRAKVRPSEAEESFQIATIRNKPFTAKQNMRQPAPLDQHVIHITRPYQANFTVGQDLTGMAFRVDAATEHNFNDFANVYQQFKKNDFISLWTFLTKEQSIFNYEYTLSFDNQKSTAKSATFTAVMETVTKREFDEKDSYAQQGQTQQQPEQPQNPELMTTSFMFHNSETENVAQAPQATLSRPSHNPAKPTDTSANSQERRTEFLKKASQHIKDGDTIAIDLSATFKGRSRAEFVATAAMAMSDVSDAQRALVYLRKKSADQQEKQFALTAEFKTPRVPLTNFLNIAKAQPDVYVKTAVAFGQELDSSASQIDAVARLHRSKGQLEYIRRSPMGKLCVEQMHKGDFYLPACQNVTIRANLLNNYDVNIVYDRISEQLQNVTYKAYSLARDFGWQFNSESVLGVNNGEKKMAMAVRFDREYEAVNVSIAAPSFNSHFENIRLDRRVAAVVVAHPAFTPAEMLAREFFRREAFPVCVVTQTAVNTFNNKTFPVNMGKNWHVVFTSAYKKGSAAEKYNNLVILARETSSSEHQKEVVILAGPNVIELTYARDFARVNVNKNTIKVSDKRVNSFSNEHRDTWAMIYGRPDGSVKIKLPQFQAKILYDRSSLVVNTGSPYRDQTRGLCGLFNGEEASDFTSPRNCVLKESKDFAASYIIKPTGTAANDQENAKAAKCVARHASFGNLRSEQIFQDQESAPTAGCVDFKVKVIEQGGQTCFSKRPQPTCSSHCQPENEIEKNVEFACISDPEVAAQWQRHIRMSSSLPAHLARSAASKRINMNVPESCQP